LRGKAQGLPRAVLKLGRSHPAERLLKDEFAISQSIIVPQNDGRIESATIQSIQNIARHGHTHFHHKPRLRTTHPLEEKRKVSADDVMADTNDQPSLFNGK
jgi:hypothetical protein